MPDLKKSWRVGGGIHLAVRFAVQLSCTSRDFYLNQIKPVPESPSPSKPPLQKKNS